jgi:aminopeptidase N
MRISVTVPAPLVCASNGRLEGVDENADGTRTWRWHVTTPISNYTVALNIAPYVTIEREYTSVAGDTFPVTYWVLPEHRAQGEQLMEQILAHLRFFEARFGPYPFRADKYGVVETPHLGMEHQTIIAYGNEYRDNEWGFDWLHHHEFAHEWFANLVTAPDWNDFWIHEGFATYAQNLYVEELHGAAAYRKSMADIRPRILNRRAVAPREPRTSGEMYFLDLDVPPGQRQSDSDIYFKGAWILHTLRWLLGDEDFALFLHRAAYPDPALEATTDGSACRFATTDDLLAIAEDVSGRDLDWFFELYLRQPELPGLEVETADGALRLRWRTPTDLPFPMPVEVRVGEELVRVEMPGGEATVELPAGAEVEVDPHDWLLRAE